MARKEDVVKRAKDIMHLPDRIRNIGIVAHVDHGKTTLSDNLVAGAGLISEDLAGKQLVLDFLEVEQERGITVGSANISMVYKYEGNDYLINLIDTPGHVDFGADVTRAMRAVDGIILVVCGVEGVQIQTERNLIQALKEKVKPILFINKIDRLIKELQLSPEEMQARFVKIITKVNDIIKRYAPEEFKEEWLISPEKGNVAFGSAYHNWALSVPMTQKTGVTFKDVYEMIEKDDKKGLRTKLPLVITVLDMVVKHLPDPKTAQKYRIPTIWKGDINSDIGKSLLECDPNGPLAVMITKLFHDPHAGFIATGRVFSGTVTPGKKVKLIGAKREATIQQVSLYMGGDRVLVDTVPAGNIVAIGGIKEVESGETISDIDMEPFEEIKHYSEPVVTKSIEPKNPKDLHKLIEALRAIAKEDPSIKVQINEETGECLVSGMGELHLEIVEWKLKDQKGIDIKTSPPIVIYRETVLKSSETVEGKSPNRHNKFYIMVEPLEDTVYQALVDGEVSEGRVKDQKETGKILEKFGLPSEEAKRVWDIKNNCLFIDQTKGVQYLHEAKELICQAFEEAMDCGPLAQEKVTKIKVKLIDTVLHEDAVHRGPAQVIPAVKRAIYAAMLLADCVLMEPKQRVFISAPIEYMGNITRIIQSKRGKIINMNQTEDGIEVECVIPVSEMFTFADEIRSETQGRALWSVEYAGYELLPRELQDSTVKQIRERKGLPPEPPTAKDFMEM